MKNTFFSSNRNTLVNTLKCDVAVFTSYSASQQSGDMAAPFMQEANFWYLTGINEPDWRLVIEGAKSWLIAPEVDDVHAVFDGNLSAEQAIRISGVNDVLGGNKAKTFLNELAGKYTTVYSLGDDPRSSHYDFELNPAPKRLHKELRKIFNEVKDCRIELTRLRAIKQPEEIESIKKAIALTCEAFANIKERLSSFSYEYELEADFSYHFRRNGALGHAYEPIVASGKHACTLHYNKNSAPLLKNQLLLMDIGARIDGYTADITRTYAIGTPTERQAAVHTAVESAHREIIALIKPELSVKEYGDKVDEIMRSALSSLNLLHEEDDYRKYFPHAISHGLGIDVHDSLGSPEVFKTGMVLTVEPGIYIPEEGIGVRIEDDILVTETGHENLSVKLPTTL